MNWKGCKNVEQGTSEWLEARKGVCTASRAGGLLGMNPNLSANKAWKQIYVGEEEVHATVAQWMQMGTDNEPAILAQAEKTLGTMTSFGKLYWTRSTPTGKTVGASPDGIIHTIHGLRLVEAKTSIVHPALKPKTHHLVQCVMQMYCLNLAACYLIYDYVGGEGTPHLFTYYLLQWGPACEKIIYELDDVLDCTPPLTTKAKDKDRRFLLLKELNCTKFTP